MARIVLVVAGAALILAGALIAAGDLNSDGSEEVGASCARQEGLGCLVVTQRFKGPNVYIEGAFSFVTVTGEGQTLQRELEGPGATRRVTSLALDPGTYEVSSYQRPCEASCPPSGSLDPPTDRCEGSFTVQPGAQVTASVVVKPGSGCTMDLTG